MRIFIKDTKYKIGGINIELIQNRGLHAFYREPNDAAVLLCLRINKSSHKQHMSVAGFQYNFMDAVISTRQEILLIFWFFLQPLRNVNTNLSWQKALTNRR